MTHCKIISCIFLIASCLSISLFSADNTALPIVNAMCPVLLDEPIDSDLTIIYKNQQVGFCCKKCIRKFKESPEKYSSHITPMKSVASPDTTNQQDAPLHTTDAFDQKDTESEHSHQHGDPDHQHGKSVFAFFGGFHVLAIHFPIALLLTATCVALINLHFKKSYLLSTAIMQTHVGSISSLGSTLLGWSAWMEANYPGAEDILFWHQWLGTATCLCAIAASCAIGTSMQEAKHPRIWLTFLVISGILVSITGHFGGTLIYG